MSDSERTLNACRQSANWCYPHKMIFLHSTYRHPEQTALGTACMEYAHKIIAKVALRNTCTRQQRNVNFGIPSVSIAQASIPVDGTANSVVEKRRVWEQGYQKHMGCDASTCRRYTRPPGERTLNIFMDGPGKHYTANKNG